MAKNNLYLNKVIRDYESRQYYYKNRRRNFYNSCDSINSFENFNETKNANKYFIQLQDELKRKEKEKIKQKDKYYYILTQLDFKIKMNDINNYEAMYILINIYDKDLSKFKEIVSCNDSKSTKIKSIELYGFYDIKFIKHLLTYYRTYNKKEEVKALNLKKTK